MDEDDDAVEGPNLKSLDSAVQLCDDWFKNIFLCCLLRENFMELEDFEFGLFAWHADKVAERNIARFFSFLLKLLSLEKWANTNHNFDWTVLFFCLGKF